MKCQCAENLEECLNCANGDHSMNHCGKPKEKKYSDADVCGWCGGIYAGHLDEPNKNFTMKTPCTGLKSYFMLKKTENVNSPQETGWEERFHTDIWNKYGMGLEFRTSFKEIIKSFMAKELQAQREQIVEEIKVWAKGNLPINNELANDYDEKFTSKYPVVFYHDLLALLKEIENK